MVLQKRLKLKFDLRGALGVSCALVFACNALISTSFSADKFPVKTDVLVIGAGLSGLATAYELKKAGISFHVLELTPRVGGRVRTVKYTHNGEDLAADSGMEEYWESNPAVALLKELRLPVRSDFAASSIVLPARENPSLKQNSERFQRGLATSRDSRQLEILSSTDDSASFLKRILTSSELKSLEKFKATIAPMAKELNQKRVASKKLISLKDLSFADWVLKQGLPKRVSEWVRVSIECEIGTEWTRIAALDGISEFHIFLGDGEKSYRVIGGNEKFTDALAAAIGNEHISLNQKVNRVHSEGTNVRVAYLDVKTNVSREINAKYVVSTVPLFRLSELQFVPSLSDEKWRAIQTQQYGAYFKAHVFVPASAQKHWSKEGKSFLPILSDSELGVIYDGNPDQDSKTKIISLLITGSTADQFNMMPLDQVRARLNLAFEKLWPGMTKEIERVEFYRIHPRAIAAWPVGRSRFDDLSQAIRRPENHVYLAGDFTESSHSDGAFISAQRVAEQIKREIASTKH